MVALCIAEALDRSRPYACELLPNLRGDRHRRRFATRAARRRARSRNGGAVVATARNVEAVHVPTAVSRGTSHRPAVARPGSLVYAMRIPLARIFASTRRSYAPNG